jgi:L-fucose mutarotase
MLKNLNPLLGPELLFTLRAMGHGDEIAIVDGNYPADAHAQRVVRADGHHAGAILDAVLSVMTLDDFVDQAAFAPWTAEVQPVHENFRRIVKIHEPDIEVATLKGEEFYNRVRSCYAIIATSEPALYGNIVLRKGVVRP